MPSIKIEIQDQGVTAALNRLLAAGENPEPVLKLIGERLLRSTEERFQKEQAPSGARWQELAPATRKRKKHPKILTETQRLRNSIIYQVTGNTLEVGTNVVYAAIHQFGGTIERAAYSTWRNLRLGAKGKLLRQGAEGPLANLAVFTSRKHKRVKQVKFTVGAHGIGIPARPFLGVSETDRAGILEIINDHLKKTWGG